MKILISHFCDNFLLHIPPPPPQKEKEENLHQENKNFPLLVLGWKAKNFIGKNHQFQVTRFFIFFEVQVKFQLGLVPAFDFLSKCGTVVLFRTRLFNFQSNCGWTGQNQTISFQSKCGSMYNKNFYFSVQSPVPVRTQNEILFNYIKKKIQSKSGSSQNQIFKFSVQV